MRAAHAWPTLPWLHTKFSALLAALTFWLIVEHRRRRGAIVALLAPIAASLVAWLTFFYVVYGRFDPQAPYGAYASQFVAFENVPRSLMGMLFDQKFGLLVYAPVYAAAAVGAWFGLQDQRWRRLTVAAIATAVTYVGASARFYMWWGGASAPARFLVPVIPLAAPLIALALAQPRGEGRTLTAALGVITAMIGLTAALGGDGHVLFSDPHGTSQLVARFEGSVPLDAVLPTFTEEDWRTPLAHLPSRIGGTLPIEARQEAVVRGELAFLDAFDPPRRRAFDYTTRSKLTPPAWLDRAPVAVDRTHFTDPLPLPPGRYDVRAFFEDAPAVVSSTLELPIGAPKTGLDLVDGDTARRARRIELVARAIVPASQRPHAAVLAVDAIAGRPNAFIAYSDEHVYPEGRHFWTRGTSRATVLIVPSGASNLQVTLHVGPPGATVQVNVGGRRSDVVMGAEETRAVRLAVPAGTTYLPLTVGASRAFRPADYDEQSTDMRLLGCQVRVELP